MFLAIILYSFKFKHTEMSHSKNIFSLLSIFSLLGLCACQSKKDDPTNLSAYFGGKINQPKSNYVLFCKDNTVMDTLYLNENNEFGKKFDLLNPGMYIIKYGNNNKYVYFDKNDSLFLRINTQDFENMSSFYGTGNEKNNFLLELFAAIREDNNNTEYIYRKPYKLFKRSVDSLKDARTAMYLRRKTEIGWSKEFDQFAKAMVDYSNYSRLEGYSFIRNRYENLKNDTLPIDYFSYRNQIDFNKEQFSEFKPFTQYLAILLSSITHKKEITDPLQKGLLRIQIVDSLISNKKVKNKVLNDLAYNYLLEDQNIENNNVFIKKYVSLSNDELQINEIKDLLKNINSFKKESPLKDFTFRDRNLKSIQLKDTIHQPTLIYFWSKNAMAHFKNANQRIEELQKKFPKVEFICINIDNDQRVLSILDRLVTNPNTIYLQTEDFETLREKWIILRLNRAIYLNSNGTINNGFVNIFDKNIHLN